MAVVMSAIAWHILASACPRLEWKTWPKFHPVSLSLSVCKFIELDEAGNAYWRWKDRLAPCSNYLRSAAFNTETYIFLFHNTIDLSEEVYNTEPSTSISVPWMRGHAHFRCKCICSTCMVTKKPKLKLTCTAQIILRYSPAIFYVPCVMTIRALIVLLSGLHQGENTILLFN
jgi:hypothetical protein